MGHAKLPELFSYLVWTILKPSYAVKYTINMVVHYSSFHYFVDGVDLLNRVLGVAPHGRCGITECAFVGEVVTKCKGIRSAEIAFVWRDKPSRQVGATRRSRLKKKRCVGLKLWPSVA